MIVMCLNIFVCNLELTDFSHEGNKQVVAFLQNWVGGVGGGCRGVARNLFRGRGRKNIITQLGFEGSANF